MTLTLGATELKVLEKLEKKKIKGGKSSLTRRREEEDELHNLNRENLV